MKYSVEFQERATRMAMDARKCLESSRDSIKRVADQHWLGPEGVADPGAASRWQRRPAQPHR